MHQVEHAIVGGGVAGSSLALRLVGRGLGRVALIDPQDRDPRTFAFWARGPLLVDPLIVHEWSRLRIRGPRAGQDQVLELGDWRYAIVPGQALRDRAVQAVSDAGGLVLHGAVHGLRDQGEHCDVRVDGQRVQARWLYDSRLREPPGIRFRQTFRGAWIDTPDDVFDPDEAVLMDFHHLADAGVGELEHGVRFFHVMPTSARRALVTVVAMAPGRPELDVAPYLREGLGLETWTVEREERGSTPLTDHRFARRVGDRVVRIGNAGGRLKASTGYAFVRIQRDAERMADSLATHGHPFDVGGSRWGWRFLDGVLLELLHAKGQRAEAVFLAMFERHPVDRVLRFLDEDLSVQELPAFVRGLPHWGWFVGAVFRWLGRSGPAWDGAASPPGAAAEEVEPYRHQASSVAFAVACLALGYMLAPFIVVLLAAVVLVVVTYPWYRALSARVGRWPASGLLTLAVVVVILVPVSFAGWLAVSQIVEIADDWVRFATEGGVVAWLDHQIALLPEEVTSWLSLEEIERSVQDLLRDVFAGLVNRAGPVLNTVLSTVVEGTVQAGVFIVVLASLYVEGPALAAMLRRVSPLPRVQMVRLSVVFEQFAYNVVVGMLATSAGQGLVAALGFWLVGADRIALLGFTTAVASQVPLVGAAVVWAPVAVSFLAAGEWGKALFVTVWSLALTASVDNVIKPFIYRAGLRVHPALVLLSLLGGLLTFGPAGLLVGPFVLVLFLALLTFHDPASPTAQAAEHAASVALEAARLEVSEVRSVPEDGG